MNVYKEVVFLVRMENDMIRKKAEFFLEKKINVHIQKRNGQFYNGLVLECSSEHLVMIDRKVGELIIFFSEITKFEPYKGEGK